MAKRNDTNTTPKPEGLSLEDRALATFSELMINRIQEVQNDWKKPWFSPKTTQPMNLSSRPYNGMNSIILMLQQEKNGWETSRYATFDRISSLNYIKDKQGARKPAVDDNGEKLPLVSIKKGEKATPVMLTVFNCVNQENRERIKYEDYKQLTEEERAKYNVYPSLKTYLVFNLDQTNLKEARPEMYQKYMDEDQGAAKHQNNDKTEFQALDAMVEKDLYVCPIKPTPGDDAYYSISRDEIVIPPKTQFVDNEAYWSNLLHEMGHASGAESRLGRLKSGATYASAAYSREELVAELTAALISTQHGMEKHVKEDSAAYLKSWLDQLHESPEFIKTVLMDVKRASSFINQRIDAVDEVLKRDGWEADFSEVRSRNKSYTPQFDKTRSAQREVSESQNQNEQLKPENKEQAEEVAAKQQPRFHR